MQGDCAAINDDPTDATCTLSFLEDGFETLPSASTLWLSHLRLRLATATSQHAGLFLSSAVDIWMTHVILEGDGDNCRGMDLLPGSRLFMQGAACRR
jgi:hypothetical protein